MTSPSVETLTYVVNQELFWWNPEVAEDGDIPTVTVTATTPEGCRRWTFDVEQFFAPEPFLRLRIPSDALDAFSDLPQFFTELAARKPTMLRELRKLLERHGAWDVTARPRPGHRISQQHPRLIA